VWAASKSQLHRRVVATEPTPYQKHSLSAAVLRDDAYVVSTDRAGPGKTIKIGLEKSSFFDFGPPSLQWWWADRTVSARFRRAEN
jgi:hypothetical protein